MTATRRGPIGITRPGHGHTKPASTGGAPKLQPANADVPYPALRGDEPCRRADVDPETFWPEGAQAEERTAEAKRLCDGCRIGTRTACLAWALANPTLAGEAIWAGLTAGERRNALRRFKKNAATATPEEQG
ncbi:WhiB family transcriptional regulator [Kitasatospora sp. NPDC088264]|uniref:WhiB family transcriptional regulator n=1 Tax=Kitasatospora sp. NPDC088264 TaxID=3155296 RepID=UPI003427393E